jgi:hypothetical protein
VVFYLGLSPLLNCNDSTAGHCVTGRIMSKMIRRYAYLILQMPPSHAHVQECDEQVGFCMEVRG